MQQALWKVALVDDDDDVRNVDVVSGILTAIYGYLYAYYHGRFQGLDGNRWESRMSSTQFVFCYSTLVCANVADFI